MQQRFVLLVLVLASAACAAARDSNLLRSKAQLTGLASRSVVPVANFTNIPGLVDSFSASVQGPWVVEFLDAATAVSGYENFYATDANVYPGLVAFDVAQDALNQTDIVYVPAGTGLASSAVSANPARPYAAMSFYTPIPAIPGLPDIVQPHNFQVSVYKLANGKFSDAPSLVIPQAAIDPEAYTATISYNGIAGMSKDGRFLVYTYAIGAPSGAFPAQVIVGNRFAVVELLDDATAYAVRAIVDSPATEKPGFASFAQKAIMEERPGEAGVYDVIIAVNSWNLANPLGITAQLAAYKFDDASSAFELQGTEWAPQYIQGVGYDAAKARAWIICNGVDVDGTGTDQVPRAPYANPAVDKSANLRMHELDRATGAFTYEGGVDLQADGIQVQPSRSGKLLFATTAPAITNDLFVTFDNPLTPVGRRYAPNVVTAFSVNGAGKLQQEWSAAASPLAFALGASPADDRLIVAGQDTYEAIGTRFVGQRGTQLYKVSKSNK